MENHGRLDPGEINSRLSRHSQADLEQIESYERAHGNRGKVLDKLKWIRGAEPMPGYDQMDSAEIVEKLGSADMKTMRKVRAYEQKFANRGPVLDGVTKARARLKESRPQESAPVFHTGGVKRED